MPPTWVHRTMIVPLAQIPAAQDLCAGLAGSAGSEMFICALASTPEGPQTHGMSTGLISPQFADLMPLWQRTMLDKQEAWNKVSEGEPAVIVALAAQQGISLTLAAVSALLSVVWVSDEPWPLCVAHLGLIQVRSESPIP